MRTYINLKCLHCGGELYYSDLNQLRCENCGPITSLFATKSEPGIAVGSLDPNSLPIEADNITLSHKDLGMTIDIPFSTLCKIETIEINGIKFKKEN